MANQPYWNPSDKDSDITLSTSDRQWSGGSGVDGSVRSTVGLDSGKWYIELTQQASGGSANRHGFATASHNIAQAPGNTATSWCITGAGTLRTNSADGTDYTNYNSGDTVNLYIDIDNGRIWYGRNGTPYTGNPAAGTGAPHTFTGGTTIYLAGGINSSGTTRGATLKEIASYSSSPPSGFTAGWGESATQNLTPTSVENTSSFGAPTVSATYALTQTSVTNTSDFGAPTVTTTVALAATGVLNTSDFGSHVVDSGGGLIVSGIDNVSELGAPTVTTSISISATGVENTSAFGSALLTLFLSPASIDNSQSFGTVTVRSVYPLIVSGVTNTNTFGTIVVARIFRLTPPGIENTSAFGSYVLIFDQRIISAGVANLIEFGTAVITRERNYKPVRRNLNSIIRMRM